MTFPPQPEPNALLKLADDLAAIDAQLHDGVGHTPAEAQVGTAIIHVNAEALDAVFTELRDRGQAALQYGRQLVAAKASLAAANELLQAMQTQLQAVDASVLAQQKAALEAENAQLKGKLGAAKSQFGTLAARVEALEAAAKTVADVAELPEAAPTPKGG